MLSRFGTVPRVVAWLTTLVAVASTGCAATKVGATDADFAKARAQASEGGNVFSQECAHCHGERGEGLAGASPILGPGALPEFPRDNSGPSATIQDPQQIQIQIQTRPAGAPWRDPFRDAQDLNDFTRSHMPKSRAEALKPDEYWAVVTFMVAAQGGQVPPGGINPSNARATAIPRR
ncbi:MAG TPA: c-type cytochrome [Polyangiaceae bacterium]|nr:c-type cytochrome [Polyangiaceae bacterium]